MNETILHSHDDIREPKSNMVRVWDPLVRLFHWSLAAGFTIAFVTEDDLLALHVWAGYLILGLIVIRALWGLVGPRHARWSDFVKEPAEIFTYLKAAIQSRAARYLGHNPAGGAMVVALMLSLTVTGLTGLAVYGAQELSGPMAPLLSGLSDGWAHALEDIHEVMANLTLLLVLLHLVGVALASLQHRENLVRAMITGLKRSRTE
ncbi:MAG: cytochrome b/b6 domain-containing protein [Thiogranum sp.]